MPGASDTAYPRLKANPSAKELEEIYTPGLAEVEWAQSRSNARIPRLGLLVLLKTFQRLGYFIMCDQVPAPIVEHIAVNTGYSGVPDRLADCDAKAVRNRHITLVLDYLNVKGWSKAAEHAMVDACGDAARTRDDLADIINVAIEELVRQRFELPSFSTLLRAARAARTKVNRAYHGMVRQRLGEDAQEKLRMLITRSPGEVRSSWDRLKTEPKRPTAQHTADFLDHLKWLREHSVSAEVFNGVPDAKIKQFAAEARSLDLSSIFDCVERKRLTLVAALIVVQIGRALDDAADMFIRLVQKVHNHARDALLKDQVDHVERTDVLVSTLRHVTLAYLGEG